MSLATGSSLMDALIVAVTQIIARQAELSQPVRLPDKELRRKADQIVFPLSA
ncbi:hypothetical protein IF2G_06002 [Cordyceps javanica]|nr:hypothetical protein IF2G_06002 [Cordyceps javanica]